jgi:hypothetical protein
MKYVNIISTRQLFYILFFSQFLILTLSNVYAIRATLIPSASKIRQVTLVISRVMDTVAKGEPGHCLHDTWVGYHEMNMHEYRQSHA